MHHKGKKFTFATLKFVFLRNHISFAIPKSNNNSYLIKHAKQSLDFFKISTISKSCFKGCAFKSVFTCFNG